MPDFVLKRKPSCGRPNVSRIPLYLRYPVFLEEARLSYCRRNRKSALPSLRREWRNIDILIILKDDIVLIENKVDTIDHSNQLKRYQKIAEETFPNKYKHYVYLTPFGSDPQDASV
jgi:hypothetical protein